MKIVGCDLHTRYQQIAMLDEETGELVERRLEHGNGEAKEFVGLLYFLSGENGAYAELYLQEIVDGDIGGDGCRRRCCRCGDCGGRGCCGWSGCCGSGRSGRLSSVGGCIGSALTIFFHLLHPFNRALVGAWKYGFDLAEACAYVELSPAQGIEIEAGDLAESELREDGRSRVGDDRVSQYGDDAQRLGRGVEDSGQAGARVVIGLFRNGPGLRLDDVFIDGAEQRPERFQRTRELVAIEEAVVIGDRLVGQLADGGLGGRVGDSGAGAALVAGSGRAGTGAGLAQRRHCIQFARCAAGRCDGPGVRDAGERAAVHAAGAHLFRSASHAGARKSHDLGWHGELHVLRRAGAI